MASRGELPGDTAVQRFRVGGPFGYLSIPSGERTKTMYGNARIYPNTVNIGLFEPFIQVLLVDGHVQEGRIGSSGLVELFNGDASLRLSGGAVQERRPETYQLVMLNSVDEFQIENRLRIMRETGAEDDELNFPVPKSDRLDIVSRTPHHEGEIKVEADEYRGAKELFVVSEGKRIDLLLRSKGALQYVRVDSNAGDIALTVKGPNPPPKIDVISTEGNVNVAVFDKGTGVNVIGAEEAGITGYPSRNPEQPNITGQPPDNPVSKVRIVQVFGDATVQYVPDRRKQSKG